MIDKAVAIASRRRGDLLLVRRHAPGARLGQGPAHRQVGRRRRADRLFADGRRGAGRAESASDRWYSSPWASRRPPRPTPWPWCRRPSWDWKISPCWSPTSWCRRPCWPCSSSPSNRVQGFLAAGHVCTITGMEEYRPIAEEFHVPIVVTGFEPLDILQGVLMCVEQLEAGRAEVVNQYARSVRPEGNRPAMRAGPRGLRAGGAEVAGDRRDPRQRPGPARGLSAVRRRAPLRRRGDRGRRAGRVHCRRGVARPRKPHDCPAFGIHCTPERPLGAPMVSAEGACAAYYRYRRN